MSTIQANQKITPFLWFNREAEEAAKYYTGIFKNSKIKAVTHYPANTPMPAGTVMTVVFELAGMEFIALNGGPEFTFTEAISLSINCKDQEEIDYYWNKLTADGGTESVCGWLKDKYGLSWQVTPQKIEEWLNDSNTNKPAAVMQAVMKMKKLDLKTIQEAFESAT